MSEQFTEDSARGDFCYLFKDCIISTVDSIMQMSTILENVARLDVLLIVTEQELPSIVYLLHRAEYFLSQVSTTCPYPELAQSILYIPHPEHFGVM
jgi:hypothetical protein